MHYFGGENEAFKEPLPYSAMSAWSYYPTGEKNAVINLIQTPLA